MKKSLWLVFVSFFTAQIYSQVIYSKRMGDYWDNTYVNHILFLNNGTSLISYDYMSNSRIVNLSSTGDTIWSKEYTEFKFDKLFEISGNQIAFTGNLWTALVNDKFFGVMDYLGNVLWVKKVASTSLLRKYDIDTLANSKLLYTIYGKSGLLWVKCDYDGGNLESKIEKNVNPILVPRLRHSVATPDSGWISVAKEDNKLLFVRHDKFDSIVTSFRYIHSPAYESVDAVDIDYLNDTTLLVLCDGTANKSYLYFLSSNGDQIAKYGYFHSEDSSNTMIKFKEFYIHHDTIFVLGYSLKSIILDGITIFKGFLVKLNLNGEVISGNYYYYQTNIEDYYLKYGMSDNSFSYSYYEKSDSTIILNNTLYNNLHGCYYENLNLGKVSFSDNSEPIFLTQEPVIVKDTLISFMNVNVLYANGCGEIAYFSISENELAFKAYPNPFTEKFIITGLNANEKYLISMFDIKGVNYINKTVDNLENVDFDCSYLSSGFYFIKLHNIENGNSHWIKVVKN
jgi:hypothetical protein